MSIRVVVLLAPFVSSVAFADPVCHQSGNGKVKQIDVSINAHPAHLRHGDSLPVNYFRDADGDGVGTALDAIESCGVVEGYVATSGDVDDTNPAVITTPSVCVNLSGVWNVVLTAENMTWTDTEYVLGNSCDFGTDAFHATGDGVDVTALGDFEGVVAECTGGVISANAFYFDCPVFGGTFLEFTR